MRLGTLEGGCETSSCLPVFGEDMENGIDTSRAHERGPAGAQEGIDGSGDA